MLTTEYSGSATERPTQAAEYALRLLTGTDGERVISIPPGKHSIGSGPRCSLRLQYSGIQPLECLIVHDEEGLRARRWSESALVNGEAFDDVRLTAGDMLTLGPIDLEVVGPAGEDSSCDRGTPTERMWHEPEQAAAETASEADEAEADELAADHGSDTQVLQPLEANTDWDTLLTVSEAEAVSEAGDEGELPVTECVDTAPVPQEAKHYESRRRRRWRAALRRQRREHDELAARVEDLARKIELALAEPAVPPVVVATPEPTPLAANDEFKLQSEELTAELSGVRDRLATREAELERARYAIDVLERQLIDSQHTMHAYAEERVTWEEQFNQLESRLAEYVGRIQELELQLDQVRVAHEEALSLAASAVEVSGESAEEVGSAMWADDFANTEAVVEERFEAETVAEETVDAADEPTTEPPLSETAIWEEVVEEPAAEAAEAVAEEFVAGEEGYAEVATVEAVAEPEMPPVEDVTVPEEAYVPEQAAVQEVAAPEDEAEVDAALDHLRGMSIWREEPAATDGAGHDEAASPVEEEPAAAPAPATESFIDRYSHLFPAEDDSSAPPVAPSRAVVEPTPSYSHELHGSSEGHGDEESVEQYMARLLERMRGPGAPPLSAEESTVVSQASQLESTVVSEPVAAEPENQELITDLEELKSSAPAPERSHSMAAMRELANESARHAIGVHTARRLRGAARTQSIIAILGAAVGIYLLIEAPNWQTLQFAGGCVAGFVALYWGKLTFFTLIEGIRLGAFEQQDDEVDPEKALHPPLPIDVEPSAEEVVHPTVAEQESTYSV